MEELIRQYIQGFRQAITEQGVAENDFDKVWTRLTEKLEPDHLESIALLNFHFFSCILLTY